MSITANGNPNNLINILNFGCQYHFLGVPFINSIWRDLNEGGFIELTNIDLLAYFISYYTLSDAQISSLVRN